MSATSPTSVGSADLDFLQEGGEAGAALREVDWSRSAIGAPETWSPALRAIVSLLLADRAPAMLWWGPERIAIYNDACRVMLGCAHPHAMGQPAAECWHQQWDRLRPVIDTPLKGGPATWVDDLELGFDRNDGRSAMHFTVACRAVLDDAASTGIGGVLATFHARTDEGERPDLLFGQARTSKADAKVASSAGRKGADHSETASSTLPDVAADDDFPQLAARNSSEEPLKLAIEDAGMGTWDTDLVSGRAVWSATHFEALGYPVAPDGAASYGLWRERVHPEDVDRVEHALQAARSGSDLYRVVYRIVRADDGGVRWLSAYGRFMDANENGLPRRSVGVFLDVTDEQLAGQAREAVDRALRSRTAQFETLLKDAPLGVYLLDADLRVRAVNPLAQQVFGSDGEVLGRDFDEVMHALWPADYADEILRLFRHTLATGEPHVELEHVGRRRDRGANGYYEWQINRIPLPDGGHGVACYFREISARVETRLALERLTAEREQLLVAERAARAEAEIANRAKDEFLATLSHELRTPLSNIVSWSKVAQRKASPGDEQLKRALGIIVDSAMAQSQLMSDMLDMSRIVSGRVLLDAQPLDIVELVAVTVAAIRPTAEAKGIHVEVKQFDDSVLISGDATRLRQVLWNLLSNAIKFTASGGRVSVATHMTREGIVVAVQDTGEGIPRELQPHIFDRFRQADGSVSRRHGGLGLGLAIVKQLVELHGGAVEVASAGVGRGSTFSVTLPVLSTQLRSPLDMGDGDAEPEPPTGRVLAGCRVMIVEDQPESLEHLTQLLEEHGATTVPLPSGREALAALRDAGRPVDVIVSDIGMPEMDGYQFIRSVRQELNLSSQRLPAIAVSAFARDEDRARSLRLGFQAHLTKPYQVSHLVASVQRLAAGRQV